MVCKVLFFVLAVWAHQGYCLTEVRLDDRNVNIIRHEHLGSSISIPKPIFDTLRTCHITYPDGRRFEAYPQNNLPNSEIFFKTVRKPFTSCSIGFRNPPVSFSGTYELMDTVVSSTTNGVTLTRQRFNIRISEPEF
ncbi:MG7 protein [Danaus plexippus plexippus]|uniref:MG7 protein n=1 Tax=Danaus plexippus plexippus TaxID=278856 RepID=A0A212F105_DANPL|nr:MG7 protein [Danaus plexippus plexippus]